MSFWPQPRFRGRWGLGERAGSLASLSLAALFGMARLCYLYFEAPADCAIRAYFSSRERRAIRRRRCQWTELGADGSRMEARRSGGWTRAEITVLITPLR